MEIYKYRELLGETVETQSAVEAEIHIEMGRRNQQLVPRLRCQTESRYVQTVSDGKCPRHIDFRSGTSTWVALCNNKDSSQSVGETLQNRNQGALQYPSDFSSYTLGKPAINSSSLSCFYHWRTNHKTMIL